jgi:hypothetical protein
MRTYQHTAFTALDIYDILYGGHKNDAGVDFLDLYGFRFSTTLKRVRNRSAPFRCVFGSTDGYGVWKN